MSVIKEAQSKHVDDKKVSPSQELNNPDNPVIVKDFHPEDDAQSVNRVAQSNHGKGKKVSPSQELNNPDNPVMLEDLYQVDDAQFLMESIYRAQGELSVYKKNKQKHDVLMTTMILNEKFEEYYTKMIAYYEAHPHAEAYQRKTVFIFNVNKDAAGGVDQKRPRSEPSEGNKNAACVDFWSLPRNYQLGLRLMKVHDEEVAVEDAEMDAYMRSAE